MRALRCAAGVLNGLALGGLLTLAGVANSLMVPPPPWFWFPSLDYGPLADYRKH